MCPWKQIMSEEFKIYILTFATSQRKIRAILQMCAAMAHHCNFGHNSFGKIVAITLYLHRGAPV